MIVLLLFLLVCGQAFAEVLGQTLVNVHVLGKSCLFGTQIGLADT